jgi:hypothetical protein
MDLEIGMKELEEKREEEYLQYPRIVGVLSRIICYHNKVLVYGSRDVGKSLYVRLAVLGLAYQSSAMCKKKPEQKEERQGQDRHEQKEKKTILTGVPTMSDYRGRCATISESCTFPY